MARFWMDWSATVLTERRFCQVVRMIVPVVRSRNRKQEKYKAF